MDCVCIIFLTSFLIKYCYSDDCKCFIASKIKLVLNFINYKIKVHKFFLFSDNVLRTLHFNRVNVHNLVSIMIFANFHTTEIVRFKSIWTIIYSIQDTTLNIVTTPPSNSRDVRLRLVQGIFDSSVTYAFHDLASLKPRTLHTLSVVFSTAFRSIFSLTSSW